MKYKDFVIEKPKASPKRSIPIYKLSPYFNWEEMVRSETSEKHGIENIPDEKEGKSIRELVKRLLYPLRLAYGRPIRISSGYRCPELNRSQESA